MAFLPLISTNIIANPLNLAILYYVLPIYTRDIR
jgi:hypothetical protein